MTEPTIWSWMPPAHVAVPFDEANAVFEIGGVAYVLPENDESYDPTEMWSSRYRRTDRMRAFRGAQSPPQESRLVYSAPSRAYKMGARPLSSAPSRTTARTSTAPVRDEARGAACLLFRLGTLCLEEPVRESRTPGSVGAPGHYDPGLPDRSVGQPFTRVTTGEASVTMAGDECRLFGMVQQRNAHVAQHVALPCCSPVPSTQLSARGRHVADARKAERRRVRRCGTPIAWARSRT
jgi:hypothetical protein